MYGNLIFSEWCWWSCKWGSLLFWDIMQHRLVINYGRFETLYWSHLQGSSSPVPWTTWPLTMGPVSCPETLATYYQSTTCKISEGWRSHFNYSGILKPPNIQVLWYVMLCQLVITLINWPLLWVVKFSGKYITEHVYWHALMKLLPISQMMNYTRSCVLYSGKYSNYWCIVEA